MLVNLLRLNSAQLNSMLLNSPRLKSAQLKIMLLNLPRLEPDPVAEWLRRRFAMHGTITSLALPRLRSNWDGGLAFIRFADPDEADAALEALDGTPSPISGCNMFIDYRIAKPLRTIAENPADHMHMRGPAR